jgi:hypothetical protein
LHHLDRLLADHVRAEDPAGGTRDQQLGEALGVAVDHGPLQVGVACGRHHAAARDRPRLRLGQPDAGVLGVGEAPARHHAKRPLLGAELPGRGRTPTPRGGDRVLGRGARRGEHRRLADAGRAFDDDGRARALARAGDRRLDARQFHVALEQLDGARRLEYQGRRERVRTVARVYCGR